MLKHFKYWLLRKLLNDICWNSDCNTCPLDDQIHHIGRDYYCIMSDIHKAARRCWGLEKGE